MFSVTHSLTPACTSLLCSPGSEWFDFQNKTANKRKTEEIEVTSVKWYLKCNSPSLFTSSITSLCNHVNSKLYTIFWQSSFVHMTSYTDITANQKENESNHNVKPRISSILCCSNSVYFHVWFLLTIYARKKSIL